MTKSQSLLQIVALNFSRLIQTCCKTKTQWEIAHEVSEESMKDWIERKSTGEKNENCSPLEFREINWKWMENNVPVFWGPSSSAPVFVP